MREPGKQSVKIRAGARAANSLIRIARRLETLHSHTPTQSES